VWGSSSPAITLASARHVYWTDRGSNTIGRADVGGSSATQSFITGANDTRGVAVDSGHIYWANLASNTIGRADLDGQHANQSFITGAQFPRRWRSTQAASTGATSAAKRSAAPT
jgi:virginiamycin B lyase